MNRELHRTTTGGGSSDDRGVREVVVELVNNRDYCILT